MIDRLLQNLEGPGQINDCPFHSVRERAGRVASWLGQQLVRPRQPVAIHLTTAEEFTVAFLAVCMSRNIPVLLDRADPVTTRNLNLRGLLTHAESNEITAGGGREELPGTGIQWIEIPETAPGNSDERPASWQDDPAVACVLLSSGSDGQPRFYAKTFENLRVEVVELAARFDVGPRDVFVSNIPFSHLYGLIWGLLLPLFQSASIRSVFGESARGLANRCRQNRATFVCTVPVFYRHLGEPDRSDFLKGCFASVREFISSGDRLPRRVACAFAETTDRTITSVYGMTETGAIFFGRDQPREDLGTPLSYVELKIHNECLHVRGPNLPGTDWFNTGDMVSERDGKYYFLGRSRRIIKNGARTIFPVRIEECIAACDGVEDVFVFGQPDVVHGELPVAQIVVPGEDTSILAKIRSTCRQQLSASEMPRRFHIVDRIQRNPLGKTRIGRLPAPDPQTESEG